MLQLFDTHAHYDNNAFDSDRDELLAALPQQGIAYALCPATDIASARACIDLSERYAYIYAAVGVHPHEAGKAGDNDIEQLRALAAHKKVRAIGEIGLDYHYDFAPREVQRAVMRKQMALAQQLGLPVILHDRQAHADTLEIVREFPSVRGVFHCYSGSAEMAKEIMRLDYLFSFGGAVTFQNARRAIEALELIPTERIMLETDAPYMTPVPHRGKRNDSSYLHLVAEKIAEIKELSVQELAEITLRNSLRFFSIESSLNIH